MVGNPANTNSLIAMSNAKDLDPGRFTAMTRLDHNRAKAQLAAKTGATVTDITKMTIWGNHSTTQYPDLFHAEVGGKNAAELVDDQAWLENDFIPTVAKRGAAIIEARGAVLGGVGRVSAAIDHVRDWRARHPRGRLGLDGDPVRRLLRRARGHHLVVPVHLHGRQVRDRPGPRHRRVLAVARIDASVAELGRGARRRQELGLI